MSQQSNVGRRRRVLLGVTGSVAAVKAPEIAMRLSSELDVDVKVLLTTGGMNFWEKATTYNSTIWQEFQTTLGGGSEANPTVTIHQPTEEWQVWKKMGDPVMHIDLRDWADLLLIAPLSAHTLAKVATGLCDDTLSCVVRAWDFGHGVRPAKPIVLAPAMNTAMWNHPLTSKQLTTFQLFFGGAKTSTPTLSTIVAPQVKTLACGEVGEGALASVSDIVNAVRVALDRHCSTKTFQ